MTDNTNSQAIVPAATGNTAQDTVSNFNSGTLALYSSVQTDDKAGQLRLLSAISDATPLNEHLDEVIQLKDFVLQATTITGDDGTENDAVRIILIDAEGNAYSCVSEGMVKSLQNMTAIMGQPATWTEPLAIKVVEKRSRNNFRFMTISYAV